MKTKDRNNLESKVKAKKELLRYHGTFLNEDRILSKAAYIYMDKGRGKEKIFGRRRLTRMYSFLPK